MENNFYEQFGISESATIAEIKVAYRKLAFLYHPDKTGGDKFAEEKLKRINSIYEILTNEIKRNEYDKYLKRERVNQNLRNTYTEEFKTKNTNDNWKGQQFHQESSNRTTPNSTNKIKGYSIFKIYWFLLFIVFGITFNYVSSFKYDDNKVDNRETSNMEGFTQPKTGEVKFTDTKSYQYQIQDSNNFIRQPKERKILNKNSSTNTKEPTGNIEF